MPAAGAVDEPVHVDGRVPVAHQRLLAAPLVGVAPDHVAAARPNFQEGGPEFVALGDQDQVADDDRVAGVGALQEAGAPRETELDLPGGRLEPDEAAAGELEPEAPAVDRRDERAGVTGQFVARLPGDLAGALVERDQAGAVALLPQGGERGAAGRAAADVDDQ